MAAAILRINRVVDPNDRLFNMAGVMVSKTSQNRLVLTVGRNHAVLDKQNIIALSNKLHEWLGAQPADLDLAAIRTPPFVEVADSESNVSFVYDESDWAAYVKELDYSPAAYKADCAAEAMGKQRFDDSAAAEYRDRMYGTKA